MTRKEIVPRYRDEFGERFQQHILAVLVRVPGAVNRCRTALSHEYFTSDVHRAIARAVLEHFDRDGSVPTLPTLIEEVREDADGGELQRLEAEIETVFEMPVHDAGDVEQRIVTFGKRMALLAAIVRSAEMLDRGERDYSKVEAHIREAQLVGEDLSDVGVDFAADLERRVVGYLDPRKVGDEKIETGIPHLDAMLDGGLARGELGVVLAPPKRGKTTLMVT